MRFAVIVDDFELVRGGIEFQSARLAKGLQAAGHHVDLLKPSEVRAAFIGNYDWVIFEGVRRLSLVSCHLRRSRSGTTRFCLATHGSFYTNGHRSELTRVGYREPFFRGTIRRAFDFFFMSCLLRSLDSIVVLSKAESDDIHRLFGVSTGRMRVLPLFIPLHKRTGVASTSTSETETRQYFVVISLIERRKNVIGAVRAAVLSGTPLVIAGADGGQLRKVRREIERNPSQQVKYVGSVSEEMKAELLEGATALIIPSYFEGIPAVALEARAMGTRVICTRLSYAPHDPGIITCDPSPYELASRMSGLLLASERPVPAVLPTEEEVLEGYMKIFGARAVRSDGAHLHSEARS